MQPEAFDGLVFFVPPTSMAGLLLLGHLGLGDQLACSGLVRVLAAREKNVVVVCKLVSVHSIRFLYRDLPNVHLLPVEDDTRISPRFGADPRVLSAFDCLGFRIMLLGLHRGPLAPGSGFVDTFYQQANVCQDHRYTHFRVDRDLDIEQSFEAVRPYVFVHDDPERCYKIRLDTQLPAVHPGKADGRPHSNNIFAFVRLMQEAEELHCCDSSFAHLADLLDISPGRRYLHANAKNPLDRVENLFLRPGWVFVR